MCGKPKIPPPTPAPPPPPVLEQVAPTRPKSGVAASARAGTKKYRAGGAGSTIGGLGASASGLGIGGRD